MIFCFVFQDQTFKNPKYSLFSFNSPTIPPNQNEYWNLMDEYTLYHFVTNNPTFVLHIHDLRRQEEVWVSLSLFNQIKAIVFSINDR